ncbi:MAG: AAA family ATPase, partial [Chloroflexota bacterium]
MKFERIEIQNFASYYGEHAIDLTCPPDKPVILFMGGTGYGKTSIFDAINWALYGLEYEPDLVARRERPIIDYVNESALREAEADKKTVEMSCTLYFEHDDIHYYVSQLLEATPRRDNNNVLIAELEKRGTALYEVKRDGNHVKKMYDAIFLNEILPSNVKDYFLFDGDRIYNLTKPEASQEVQDAIYRVVDLELIKNAGVHLEQVAGEYRTSAKREAKGELGDIEEKYNAETERLSQHKTQLDELKQEKQALETQIRTIENKLANIPDTSELQGRRTELEREEKHIAAQIDELKGKLRSSAATSVLQLASEPTLNLIDMLDSKREKGEIPKTVSQTLLKVLIRIQTCLCGTEFTEGDHIYQELVKRLQA